MSNDKKRGEQVQKLLRLAAPNSGATEAERISAALAAAEMFVELEEKGKTERREARHRGEAPHQEPAAPPDDAHDYEPQAAKYHEPNVEAWQRGRSSTIYLRCHNASCPRPIGINEPVWRRVNCGQVEWLHENCPRPGSTGL